MCCCIPSEPISDPTGRWKDHQGQTLFQTDMMGAPFKDCPKSCLWCFFQFVPITCGCTQYRLRSKVLNYDLSRYSCFQGYFDCCCCIKAGSCGEQNCPEFCLFCESCCCNSLAVSASRAVVMDQYQLSMDPCDYRLIWFSNCLQCLSCICSLAALIEPSLQNIAQIINWFAELVYHIISGCMTAQTAYEVDYQNKNGNGGGVPQIVVIQDPNYNDNNQNKYHPQQSQGTGGNQGQYNQQQGQQYNQQQQYPNNQQYNQNQQQNYPQQGKPSAKPLQKYPVDQQ